MFNFPGASYYQLLHYLDVHIEDRQINTVVIRDGITIFLENFVKHKKMSLKCKRFGMRNIFIWGLVYTTRINIGKSHIMIQNICQKDVWFHVDKRNIQRKHL